MGRTNILNSNAAKFFRRGYYFKSKEGDFKNIEFGAINKNNSKYIHLMNIHFIEKDKYKVTSNILDLSKFLGKPHSYKTKTFAAFNGSAMGNIVHRWVISETTLNDLINWVINTEEE